MSLIQSFEPPKQEVVVHYDNGSLERIFSVHIVQQTSGSNNRGLDMPLIDMSSNEMFVNATSVEDRFNNNPDNMHATLLHTNFIIPNSLNIKQEEIEDLSTNKPDDELDTNESRQNHTMGEPKSDYFHTMDEPTIDYCHSSQNDTMDGPISDYCHSSQSHTMVEPTIDYFHSSQNDTMYEPTIDYCHSSQNHTMDEPTIDYGQSSQNHTLDEPTIDYCHSTEVDISDSLSEYLVFHKKVDATADLALNFNCYVKLQILSESEINSAKVMCEEERPPEQPRLHSMYVSPAKKGKPIAFRKDSTPKLRGSRSRKTPNLEDVSNCGPVSKRRNITFGRIVKRTGKTSRKMPWWAKKVSPVDTIITSRASRSRTKIESKCEYLGNGIQHYQHQTYQQSTDEDEVTDEDEFSGRPRIVLLFVSDRTRPGIFICVRIPERFGIKQCSVRLERLSTLQSTAPQRGESDGTSYLTRTKEVHNGSMLSNVETLFSRGTDTEDSQEVDAPNCSVVSLLPDITAAAWTGDKYYHNVEQRDLPFNPNGFVVPNQQRVKTNLFDDIEALEFTNMTNVEDSSALDTLIVEAGHSMSPLPTETNSSHANRLIDSPNVATLPLCAQEETAGSVVKETDPMCDTDDDDNCSIASDISLFASDSDTLYSPDRKRSLQPTDGWTLDKYRIPKKPPVREQVDQILAATIKNSPSMVSPIRDPPNISGSKRKRNEFRNKRPLKPKIMKTKPAKPEKAIREGVKGIKKIVQPNAVKSSGNAIQLQSESDNNAENQQQPSKMRDNGMLKGKSMESKKPTETAEKFNNNDTVEVNPCEPQKPTGIVEKFNDSRNNGTVEVKSIETQKPIGTLEQFNESRDNEMSEMLLEEKFIELKNLTTTVEQQTNRIEHTSSKTVSDLNESEHPDAAPSGNITAVIKTGIGTSGTAYKSKIDFKNLGKIVINVGNQNSRRIVSIPKADAPAVTVPPTEQIHSTTPQLHPVLKISSAQNVEPHPQFTSTAASELLQEMRSLTETPSTLLPQSFLAQLNTLSVPMGQGINLLRDQLSHPDDSPNQELWQRYSNVTLKLFKNPCNDFLAGNVPCKVSGCQYCQQPLPSAEKIVEKLRTIKDDQINWIYKNFVAAYQPIFLHYFPDICKLFGLRKMEDLLKLSIKDCEKYGRRDFYKFIHRGLMECGKLHEEAVVEMNDLVEVCQESITAMTEIFCKLDLGLVQYEGAVENSYSHKA